MRDYPPSVNSSEFLVGTKACRLQNNSGTPLRPKAARVEPHTYTKRHAGEFLWSVASGMACGLVRRTTVAFHDILT